MEQLDLEFLARDVREIAGLEDDDVALVSTVAERVMGTPVLLSPRLPSSACLRRRPDGLYEIVVRPDVPDMRFHVAHELAHYALREIARVKVPRVAEEDLADRLGAAILAPKSMVERAYRHFGERLGEIARTFGMSQTAVHLRLVEALRHERAVVTAKHENVLTSSQGKFPWADVPVVEIARGRPWRGLAKPTTMLGGIDEGRIGIRAK